MFFVLVFSASSHAACSVATVSPADGAVHDPASPPELIFSSSGCSRHGVEISASSSFTGPTTVRSAWPVGTVWTPSSADWAKVIASDPSVVYWRVTAPAVLGSTATLHLVDPIVEAYGCAEESYGSSEYLFCDTTVDFAEAATACEDWGGALLTIDDSAEDAWQSATSNAWYEGSWWMGLYEPGSEGGWAWISGSTYSYSNWAAGEPNDSGGDEDCVINNHNYGTAWNDIDCDRSFRFVCER